MTDRAITHRSSIAKPYRNAYRCCRCGKQFHTGEPGVSCYECGSPYVTWVDYGTELILARKTAAATVTATLANTAT